MQLEKKLAEHNRKAVEAKKKASGVNTQSGASQRKKENPTQESSEGTKNEQSEQSSSFSLTQVLSVVSIVVSLAGLYYKREELKRLFKNESKVEKAQREMIDHMVEAERQRISEAEKKTLHVIQNSNKWINFFSEIKYVRQ